MLLAGLLLALVIAGMLAPAWWGGNMPATKDTVLASVPWAVYQSRAFDGEESLFWCHMGGCGFPVHAESQGGFFHPLNAATAAWCPVGWIYPVRWVLVMVLGGLAMFAFLRGRSVSIAGALVGGLGYALGGFWVARLDMLPLLMSIPVLPLGWLAVEWVVRGRWGRGVALGAIATAWGLLAGHFQLTVIAIFGIVVYAIGRGWVFERIVEVLAALVIMCGIGVGIAAVQVFPSLELAMRSARWAVTGGQLGDYSLFPLQVVGVLFPRIFGYQQTVAFDSDQVWDPGSYWGSGVFWEACPYVGAGILVIAIAAAVMRYPGTWWLFVVGLIGLVLAMGKYTPLYSVIHALPGFGGFRIPSRFLLLCAGSFAALGGIGTDTLLGGWERSKWWGLWIIGIGVFMAAGLLVAVKMLPEPGSVTGWLGITGVRLDQITEHGARTLAPWELHQAVPLVVILLIGVGVLLRLPRVWIVVLVGLEMGYFAWHALPPTISFSDVTSQVNSSVQGRIFSAPLYQSGGNWHRLQALPPNANWLSGTSHTDVRGSLFDYRQGEYLQAAKQEFQDGGHRLLALAGTKTILSRDAIDDSMLVLISSGEVFTYRVADVVPMAYFPVRIRNIVEWDSPLETLLDEEFEAGEDVLLEGWKGVVVTGLDNEISVRRWGQGIIELDVTGGGGVLRIAECFDPGWSAIIDDSSAEILRADYMFMALQVPNGEHRVMLRYQAPYFRASVPISIVSGVIWLGFWVFPWKRRRDSYD